MKILGAIIITILTSLFFFPFNSSWLPEINTKLAMSVVGLLLLGYEAFKVRDAQFNRSLSIISLWALAVSFVGLVSTIINNTSDYTYTTYIVSAWVWILAAYVVITTIKWVYGRVNLRLVTNFLIVVCVVQCIMSQLTDNYEAIATWVKSFVVSTGFMGIPKNRLYGIGCALDVAGLKFCVVMILLSYFAINPSGRINKYIESSLYIISFVIIGMFGSMISRTTSIGIGFAILLWLLYPLIYSNRENGGYRYFVKALLLLLIILIPIGTYLYNTDSGFQANLRFGFEGFFSLIEKGKWEVRSNQMMMGMWVWPDSWETWIIGDGYFNSPRSNPFYIGSDIGDFYMGTDIGYCRFIFYFGIIGLLIFCGFFGSCAYQCSKNIPDCVIMFYAIFLINLIGWCKVSSDIFPIYALLLWLHKTDPPKEVVSNTIFYKLS